MSISDIDDSRPHVVILSTKDIATVIPLVFLERVASGKVSITELEDYDSIVPVIVGEWLSVITFK